jgi:hypothetical protein
VSSSTSISKINIANYYAKQPPLQDEGFSLQAQETKKSPYKAQETLKVTHKSQAISHSTKEESNSASDGERMQRLYS